MNKFSKGFTIIELLVVVAIVSILMGVTLTNVTLYINKAKDASIKGNMGTMITDGAIFLGSNNTYAGLCTDSVSGFVNAYNAAVSRMKSGGTSTCSSNENQWAALVQINNPTGGPSSNAWWCVDSTGIKKEETIYPGDVTVCP